MIEPQRARACGDRGQVGGIEVLPFGFLVFISASLLFANAWAVIDAKFAVSAAAREAVRAYVESDSATEASAAAVRRANETLDAYGRAEDGVSIRDPVLEAPFGRCVRVSMSVASEIPMIRIPFLGGFGPSTEVEATHSAVVDPFRSGVEAGGAC